MQCLGSALKDEGKWRMLSVCTEHDLCNYPQHRASLPGIQHLGRRSGSEHAIQQPMDQNRAAVTFIPFTVSNKKDASQEWSTIAG